MNELNCRVIARIRTDFPTKFGVPRQSGLCEAEAKIVFEPSYRDANALRGLDGFSHLWLIWVFSDCVREDSGWSPTVRPPRLGGNKRMGVFATRSPYRPNPIGLTVVRLLRIEQTEEGPALIVSGADMKDGTPILDVKPYLPYADGRPDAEGGWAEAVRGDKLTVQFACEVGEDLAKELETVIASDPRPGYDTEPGKQHGFFFRDYDVKFTVDGTVATVTQINKR